MLVYNHIARRVGDDVQRRINALGIGQKMQDLPEELWHESFRYYVKEDPNRQGGPNLRMIRLDPAKPSLTVTGYIFNKFVHPYEQRFVSVREAARLQCFPDNLKLEGTLTSTQLQVGNAVPVPLARAVFQQISDHARRVGYCTGTLSALSLFCGAGGMDVGAEQTRGIATKVAVDNWRDACATLRSYTGGRIAVVEQDLAAITEQRAFWSYHAGTHLAPDLLYGGPPCQAFSQAGKQKALDDKRGGLIFEFLRWSAALQPAYVVLENVANLRGVGGGALYASIGKELRAQGYNVSIGRLLAADYGAPQLRTRIFFIACKAELGTVDLPEPTHSSLPDLFTAQPYHTVAQAFEGLPPICEQEHAVGSG